ncbi:MAG: DUF1015 domain-containing protein [Spirochaetota bacterium]
MNANTAKQFERVGVRVPNILLPRAGVDLHRWAVIACDQHTSEPDYWTRVEQIVDGHPSSLHLVYPEVYLGESDSSRRIRAIHDTMQAYLDDAVLEDVGESMVLTRRSTPHVDDRRGLLLALDLEQYDYTPGAQSLTRATEQTIVDRIPPRVRIREGAPVELPHVMVLIDDPRDELFAGLLDRELERLYATELMLDGGQVSGYRVDGDALDHVSAVFTRLLENSRAASPFLFAVGDGNHSLATAKAVWEKTRAHVADDHPARFALVEIVNLYDSGLRFEPIHRLVRCTNPIDWIAGLAQELGAEFSRCSQHELESARDDGASVIGLVTESETGCITLEGSRDLPVALVEEYINLQNDLDVDYIHGWETAIQLGRESESVAILLPDFDPGQLFPTVSQRGVLPRKAFSLGEAEEKRYYLEARRIT